MRTDRELLVLAAKAAGIEVWPGAGYQARFLFHHMDKPDPTGTLSGVEWNPLTDDGDALRLAVRLNLQITPGTYRDYEATAFHAGAGEAHEHVTYMQDLYAATRRSIVRAAAEIGAKMQGE